MAPFTVCVDDPRTKPTRAAAVKGLQRLHGFTGLLATPPGRLLKIDQQDHATDAKKRFREECPRHCHTNHRAQEPELKNAWDGKRARTSGKREPEPFEGWLSAEIKKFSALEQAAQEVLSSTPPEELSSMEQENAQALSDMEQEAAEGLSHMEQEAAQGLILLSAAPSVYDQNVEVSLSLAPSTSQSSPRRSYRSRRPSLRLSDSS